MPRKLIGVLQTSGMQGPPGPKGDSYVITEKDYEEISKLVPSGDVSYLTIVNGELCIKYQDGRNV